MTQVDVAIVGAGAAGIAAARRLAARGRSVRLLEAGSRLGGRAHTIVAGGMPLDLGCGWLHSADRNPLAALADALDEPLDRSDPAWGRQLRDLGFPAADQQAAWASYERFEESLRTAPPPGDRAGDAFPREDRWRAFADALSSYINGTGLDMLSASDFLAYEDAATERNWRVPRGYGAFIADQARGTPVSLRTRVQAIDHAGAAVRIESDRGTLHARAVIVAVSTAVLAAGHIRFAPAPDAHLHAAACLPLGLADKLFLSIADAGAVPPETHLIGRTDTAATGSYYLRPFGRPVIECFLGGDHARALEGESDAAVTAFARGQLGALLGREFAAGIGLLARTRWAAEPAIGGSYSHALPGHRGARAVLARAPSERLCFAGEACSAHDFSTAHGAWASGLAAADTIEAALA